MTKANKKAYQNFAETPTRQESDSPILATLLLTAIAAATTITTHT